MTLEPSSVATAAERLRGVTHRTPVATCRAIDDRAGVRVFLKCENLQRAGAFKFRGAFNAVSQLTDAERPRGVITHSSGNHAQGLALAAKLLGVACTVVMPHDAPPVKRVATQGYGARIVPCDAVERETVCGELIAAQGHVLIHPYDDARIIAGAGTAAWELLEEVPDLSAIVAPVGGGGLSAGTCLAAAARAPGCAVWGVEPEGADDGRRSLAEGRVVTLDAVPQTIADGLRTRHVGERNLAVLSRHCAGIVTVGDDEIRDALRLLWERAKVLAEPSGAVALAGVLAGRIEVPSAGSVGVLVSGGNVDLAGCKLF